MDNLVEILGAESQHARQVSHRLVCINLLNLVRAETEFMIKA